jgi:hypothetical protein
MEVCTSQAADFSGAVSVGTFAPAADPSGMQVLDLTDTNARYVRLHLLNHFANNGVGFNEVAFGTIVPEPGSIILMGLGALGLLARRFRRA